MFKVHVSGFVRDPEHWFSPNFSSGPYPKRVNCCQQCCGSGMFIPNPGSQFFLSQVQGLKDPGSASQIRSRVKDFLLSTIACCPWFLQLLILADSLFDRSFLYADVWASCLTFRIEQEHSADTLPRSTRLRAAISSEPALPVPERPPVLLSEEGGRGGGRTQPRKLAEMELLTLKQISAMSGTNECNDAILYCMLRYWIHSAILPIGTCTLLPVPFCFFWPNDFFRNFIVYENLDFSSCPPICH